MDTTFITIHGWSVVGLLTDLSPDARILYSSDSIVDILGYSPEEVRNRSCWEFFHPEELPAALARHERGVELDKAAVLSYCRMRGKNKQWLGVEIVFSVCYDVLVGCTSIYRRGLKSNSKLWMAWLTDRAHEAPAIRRIFSNSPNDPRYHMLQHLSPKFSAPPRPPGHEPRAALFLNRYTRTLTIMYATEGLAEVLGIKGQEMIGKSWYYCIQDSCLADAVKCMENAKVSDSIAYLRFWFRDPRTDDEPQSDTPEEDDDGDTVMGDPDEASILAQTMRTSSVDSVDSEPVESTDDDSLEERTQSKSHSSEDRTSSSESRPEASHESVFGEARSYHSSNTSAPASPLPVPLTQPRRPYETEQPLELEAVVSCTSDGLVVCLRKAVPFTAQPHQSTYANGLFAVPWSSQPILPPPHMRPRYSQPTAFAPGLAPQPEHHAPMQNTPQAGDFMNSIRDIAVFAWALVGINGTMANYSTGVPRGEAQPANGLPVWDQDVDVTRNGT